MNPTHSTSSQNQTHPRWVIWAGCELVTLGVCRHLDGPMIGGSLSGVGDCLWPRSVAYEGSCAFPDGVPKATLVNCSCHWATSLVGRFLRRLLWWARCVIPISRRNTKCWSTQWGHSVPASTWTLGENWLSLILWYSSGDWIDINLVIGSLLYAAV